jgi:hypothetical protein
MLWVRGVTEWPLMGSPHPRGRVCGGEGGALISRIITGPPPLL